MFSKKCFGCAKKIEKKFNYCPYCGHSLKAGNDKKDFGMLGRADSHEEIMPEFKLPMGMEKIMGSLIKQLERQMGNMDGMNQGKMPKGISIRVTNGKPGNVKRVVQKNPKKLVHAEIPLEEEKRRLGLSKEEAESKVRRLGDRVIYEIKAPGIKKKSDVLITELATGIEVRAYSKDKCYVKVIPLKVEIIGHYVEDEKVFLEIKG